MALRANYIGLAPKAMQILMEQESYLRAQFQNSETVTVSVWELIKLRISQINQCAFCIDMPLYSDIEIASLEFAEHLTSGKVVDERSYQKVRDTLGEQALVDLTIAINAINSWNRIVKTFKPEVGSYKPE